MKNKLTSMPQHAWYSISFILFTTIIVLLTAVGFLFGYPQVLFVWLILLLWGSHDCECSQCTPNSPKDQKESAADIVSRRYAKGEINKNKVDELLDTIIEIDKNSEAINNAKETHELVDK